MKKIIPFFLIVFFLTGALAKVFAQNPDSKMTDEKNPHLVLVSLKISKVRKQYRVKKESSLLARGVYKRNDGCQQPDLKNDFFCILLNAKKEILDTILIKNPLNTRIEYPNENGEIGSTVLEKEEDFVLIRFNYEEQMNTLIIRKMQKNGKWKTLTSFSIGPESFFLFN